jgi:ribose 1,5-bisphosphokinase PhnN
VYHISDRPDRVAQRLRARGRPGSELGPRIRDNIAESIAGDQVAQRTFVNEGTLEQLVDTVAEAMATDFSGRLGAAMTPVPL